MCPSRRDFLKSSCGASTLLALAPAVPSFLSRAALAARTGPNEHDNVLVVVQLSGGNDGLNTVVPYQDDQYGRNRRTLRLPADQVHKIGSDLGFHPQMPAFARLFKEGRLSVVQGVGYPKANRDHDAAMRNWHTARPEDSNCQTGWLGRAIDQAACPEDARVPGVFVGPIARPFALNAEKSVVPTVRSADQWKLRAMPGSGPSDAHHARLVAVAQVDRSDAENPLVDFVGRSAVSAYAGSRQVEAVLRQSPGTADYPPFHLARHFNAIAQLVRADLGIRIFFAEVGGGGIGGFDNHANQRDNHGALLHHLSESVAAFIDDLARDETVHRVVLLTFSEFGRTLPENGRRGTGHGDAAPMFLAGGKVRGGLVGSHPDLNDLEGGAPKFHTDFRCVYATMLRSWLGLDSTPILGEEYHPLDLLQV